jgi:hypothetical protein
VQTDVNNTDTDYNAQKEGEKRRSGGATVCRSAVLITTNQTATHEKARLFHGLTDVGGTLGQRLVSRAQLNHVILRINPMP